MLSLRTILFLALILFNEMHPLATTLVKKSLAELLSESDGIVVGTVSELQSRYSRNKEIQTFVTLTGLRIIHGYYIGSSLTLRLRGGEINGDVLEIPDSPKFSLKDNVVLFVQGNGRAMVPIVGWTQGVFRVFHDRQTDTDRVMDHFGNPVLAVAGEEIIKGEIPPSARAAGAGKADDGSFSAPISPGKPILEGKAMPLKEFLDIISRKLNEKGLKGKSISSAKIEALSDSSEPQVRDAIPPHR